MARKFAQFAAHAAPAIESEVKLIKTAVSPTLKIAVVHCVTVLFMGCPKAVRQAEEVCTKLCVTDDTASILIKAIKSVFSSPCSEPKISLVASGAKRYSPTAAGKDTASVINTDLYAFFFAPAISPFSARGEICGMLDAASP